MRIKSRHTDDGDRAQSKPVHPMRRAALFEKLGPGLITGAFHPTTRSAPASNCISHILASIPYEHVEFDKPEIGKRKKRPDDDTSIRHIVPAVF